MSRSQVSAPPIVPVLVLLALVSMLATSVFDLAAKEKEHGPVPVSGAAAGNAMIQNEGNMTDAQVSELSTLMQKLQENPNDGDALLAIGSLFLDAQEWPRAEVFLSRAVLSRPADTKARYRLGIAQYQQEKIQDAAKTFEELLTVKEVPTAQFNLAMIYKYDLNEKDKAKSLLEKILSSPDANEETLRRAKEEL